MIDPNKEDELEAKVKDLQGTIDDLKMSIVDLKEELKKRAPSDSSHDGAHKNLINKLKERGNTNGLVENSHGVVKAEIGEVSKNEEWKS